MTQKTPSTLIIHSGNDKTVLLEDSLLIYRASVKHSLQTTLHISPKGGHGYSLGISNKNAPGWIHHADLWLET